MTWQRYALDRTGCIVDVYNVSDAYVQEQGNDSFTCLECGNPMLTKRGKIKEWHFAHIGGKNVVCSYESYLHKLGIIKFIESYKARMDANEPFFLETTKGKICHRDECPYGRKVLCGEVDGYEIVPLLPDFKKIEREVRDGDFIPDILLTADDGQKVYVEIVVSHCSELRKRKSGIPIVEIKLNTESDISLFEKNVMTERNGSVRVFNFDQYMTKYNYHCEKYLQEAKDLFIEMYRTCASGGYPLNLDLSYEIFCSHEDCPYIEKHCCVDRNSGYYDIARLCKEVPSDSSMDTFSPDFFIESKTDGEKIRFNFCFELSTKAEGFGNVRTVQFALGNDCKSKPWVSGNICEDGESVRYINFEHYMNLCGRDLRWFEVIILDKRGDVKCPGIGRIDQIHQAMSAIWDKVEDYILIPNSYSRTRLAYLPKLAKMLFEKSCNACLHCLDKKVDSTEHILTCQLHKHDCDNADALDCQHFKRNLKVRRGKMADYAYSYKYRGYEDIISAWKRYRLKM